MLGPELLRGLRAVRARGGGASRRLTGTLQGELTDVRSGLICSRSSSISSAGSSSFHPRAAGSSEFRVKPPGPGPSPPPSSLFLTLLRRHYFTPAWNILTPAVSPALF